MRGLTEPRGVHFLSAGGVGTMLHVTVGGLLHAEELDKVDGEVEGGDEIEEEGGCDEETLRLEVADIVVDEAGE